MDLEMDSILAELRYSSPSDAGTDSDAETDGTRQYNILICIAIPDDGYPVSDGDTHANAHGTTASPG